MTRQFGRLQKGLEVLDFITGLRRCFRFAVEMPRKYLWNFQSQSSHPPPLIPQSIFQSVISLIIFLLNQFDFSLIDSLELSGKQSLKISGLSVCETRLNGRLKN